MWISKIRATAHHAAVEHSESLRGSFLLWKSPAQLSKAEPRKRHTHPGEDAPTAGRLGYDFRFVSSADGIDNAAVSNVLVFSSWAGRRGRPQTPSYLLNITQLLLEPRGAQSAATPCWAAVRVELPFATSWVLRFKLKETRS
jgi:hypothetical protein